MKINKWKQTSLIVSLAALLIGVFMPFVKSFAYGGEEEIILKIVKEVKLSGDATYKDKVFIDLTNKDERVKEIFFRITVTNTGDKVEKLKMEDFLPDALTKVSGNLTEEWAVLEKDETKTFEIKATLKSTEIKEDKDYEKCVVNKAELRRDGNFAGSDVATVCYGNKPVKLPETGFLPMSGFVGLGMMSLGGLLRLGKKTKKK